MARRHPLTDGDTPLAWTPDEAGGVRRYVVEWCPTTSREGCVTDALELRWEATP